MTVKYTKNRNRQLTSFVSWCIDFMHKKEWEDIMIRSSWFRYFLLLSLPSSLLIITALIVSVYVEYVLICYLLSNTYKTHYNKIDINHLYRWVCKAKSPRTDNINELERNMDEGSNDVDRASNMFFLFIKSMSSSCECQMHTISC